MSEELWHRWARRWEAVQDAYVPGREAQFEVISHYIRDLHLGAEHRVLDLCCGAGSMAKTVLQNIPTARVTGVDADPWLLELARRTSDPSQTSWLRRDLRSSTWSDGINGPFCAVTFTTAAHWFDADELGTLYGQISNLLAPGGMLFVADIIPDFDTDLPLGRMSLSRVFAAQTCAQRSAESLAAFFADAKVEKDFAAWLTVGTTPSRSPRRFLSTCQHAGLMRSSGFERPMQIWRYDANAVLVAPIRLSN